MIAQPADLPHAQPQVAVPAPGPMSDLEAWMAPHIGRRRRQRRPWSVLQIIATPVTPAHAGLDDALSRRLIAACTDRLCASVRATDPVAQIGPRVIAVFLDGSTGKGAKAAEQRLLRICQVPYRIGAHTLHLNVSATLGSDAITPSLPSP